MLAFHRFACPRFPLQIHFITEVLNHLACCLVLFEAMLEDVKLHGCVSLRELLLFFTQFALLSFLKHLAEYRWAQNGHGFLDLLVQTVIRLVQFVNLLLLGKILRKQRLDNLLLLLLQLLESLFKLTLCLYELIFEMFLSFLAFNHETWVVPLELRVTLSYLSRVFSVLKDIDVPVDYLELLPLLVHFLLQRPLEVDIACLLFLSLRRHSWNEAVVKSEWSLLA